MMGVVYAAGLTQGLTGFGFSLVTVPVVVIILGPKTAVPVIMLLSLVLNVMLYAQSRKWSDTRRIRPLIIAGIASVPLGALLLVMLDPSVLKLVVGCAIFGFALASLLGFRREVRNERLGFVGVGLVSGTLNGAISTSGPPVILFLANQGVTKRTFRASLVTYFLFLNLAALPVYLIGGLMSVRIVKLAGLLVGPMLLGAWSGSRLVGAVPEKAFRSTTLAIVLATGVLAVLSSLGLV